jgi:hypothetical protein
VQNGFIVFVRQWSHRRLDTTTKHVDYLDGWRGGVVLLLLVGHLELLPTISGHSFYTGRLGVECFFVLSGRLMAEILFVRQTPIGIIYWRRISRIFTAFWLFLGVLTFATVFYPKIDVNTLRRAGIRCALGKLPARIYRQFAQAYLVVVCRRARLYIFESYRDHSSTMEDQRAPGSCARQHNLHPQWRDTNLGRSRLLSGLLA